MDLSNLREEIDRIDSELVSLLHQRFDIVAEVAEYKRENNLPIYVPERERQVLDRLAEKAGGNLPAGSLQLLYAVIMNLTKLNEYVVYPKNLEVPTGMGGASVRAILPNEPRSLCRYLSVLAAAEVRVTHLNSTVVPGDRISIDMEVEGDARNTQFMATLAVLSDLSEQFMLL